MGKGCLWVIGLAVAALVCTIIAVIQVYPVYADIDALLDRSQVSADANKMALRLDQLLVNMERHGITSGHAAIIFKHPQNDVGLDYEAVRDLRDRAKRISQFDEGSVEYQTGLDDMRGTLREIEIDATYYAGIRSPFVWLALVLWLLTCMWGFIALH